MTYRAAPLATADRPALITTAEHSVLGTRHIHDGPTDPLWLAQCWGEGDSLPTRTGLRPPVTLIIRGR